MTRSLRSFLRARRGPVRLAHEVTPPDPRTRAAVRALLAALLIAAMLFGFPLQVRVEPPHFREGTVAPEELIAPFAFDVPKDELEYRREQAVAAESVLPIFVRRGPTGRELNALAALRAAKGPGPLSAVQDSLGVHFSVPTQRLLASPDSGRALLAEAEAILVVARRSGLVGVHDAEILNQKPRVRLRDDEGDRTIQNFQLFDARKLSEEAATRGRVLFGDLGVQAMVEVVHSLARPNVFYDPAATERDREAARRLISPYTSTILAGERIIDANERITAEHVAILDAMDAALRERTAGTGVGVWLSQLLGRGLLVSVLVVLLGVFLRASRPALWGDIKRGTLLASILLLTILLAAVVARSGTLHPYLIPIPLAAVLLTLLVDDVVALVAAAWLAALISTVAGWGLPVTMVGLVGGASTVYAVRRVTHRMEMYRSLVLILFAIGVTVCGVVLVGSSVPWSSLAREMAWGMGGGVLSAAVAMLLLPIFEKIFDVTTNISLLELSDLNRPIFKRMMIEANGTYQHSMIIGSLAEAAAEAVGANPLLARVGAYYHDIGKIAKSTYFGENMRKGSRNPHERLTPTMSSLILESHVREGLELAREIGLPRQVAAFIPEHQGTTLMQYFYTKAMEMDPEVEENDYRYPGPRPQSKETAIVMLGDAAEATVRSLDDQAPARIRAVLDRLFELRIKDRQLDECDLTVRDLARIREAFTHVLSGVFHSRVKYQWQKEGGEEALGPSRQERVIHPELETGIGTEHLPGYANSSHASGEKSGG